MAKKARKKAGAGVSATNRKSKKVIAVKSVKPRKQPAKKPPRKAARRSAADVAKLKRAVIAGARKGKTADTLAAELGISKTYVYALKNKD
ncbi:MAG: hypothetical protein IOC86_11875 [Aestuariivirga sp.]|nr:hypothetical protein [Aestuariivirga sp.]